MSSPSWSNNDGPLASSPNQRPSIMRRSRTMDMTTEFASAIKDARDAALRPDEKWEWEQAFETLKFEENTMHPEQRPLLVDEDPAERIKAPDGTLKRSIQTYTPQVLFVSDHRLSAVACAQVLEAMGCEVTLCFNYEKAFRMAAPEYRLPERPVPYDLVLVEQRPKTTNKPQAQTPQTKSVLPPLSKTSGYSTGRRSSGPPSNLSSARSTTKAAGHHPVSFGMQDFSYFVRQADLKHQRESNFITRNKIVAITGQGPARHLLAKDTADLFIRRPMVAHLQTLRRIIFPRFMWSRLRCTYLKTQPNHQKIAAILGRVDKVIKPEDLEREAADREAKGYALKVIDDSDKELEVNHWKRKCELREKEVEELQKAMATADKKAAEQQEDAAKAVDDLEKRVMNLKAEVESVNKQLFTSRATNSALQERIDRHDAMERFRQRNGNRGGGNLNTSSDGKGTGANAQQRHIEHLMAELERERRSSAMMSRSSGRRGMVEDREVQVGRGVVSTYNIKSDNYVQCNLITPEDIDRQVKEKSVLEERLAELEEQVESQDDGIASRRSVFANHQWLDEIPLGIGEKSTSRRPSMVERSERSARGDRSPVASVSPTRSPGTVSFGDAVRHATKRISNAEHLAEVNNLQQQISAFQTLLSEKISEVTDLRSEVLDLKEKARIAVAVNSPISVGNEGSPRGQPLDGTSTRSPSQVASPSMNDLTKVVKLEAAVNTLKKEKRILRVLLQLGAQRHQVLRMRKASRASLSLSPDLAATAPPERSVTHSSVQTLVPYPSAGALQAPPSPSLGQSPRRLSANVDSDPNEGSAKLQAQLAIQKRGMEKEIRELKTENKQLQEKVREWENRTVTHMGTSPLNSPRGTPRNARGISNSVAGSSPSLSVFGASRASQPPLVELEPQDPLTPRNTGRDREQSVAFAASVMSSDDPPLSYIPSGRGEVIRGSVQSVSLTHSVTDMHLSSSGLARRAYRLQARTSLLCRELLGFLEGQGVSDPATHKFEDEAVVKVPVGVARLSSSRDSDAGSSSTNCTPTSSIRSPVDVLDDPLPETGVLADQMAASVVNVDMLLSRLYQTFRDDRRRLSFSAANESTATELS